MLSIHIKSKASLEDRKKAAEYIKLCVGEVAPFSITITDYGFCIDIGYGNSDIGSTTKDIAFKCHLKEIIGSGEVRANLVKLLNKGPKARKSYDDYDDMMSSLKEIDVDEEEAVFDDNE